MSRSRIVKLLIGVMLALAGHVAMAASFAGLVMRVIDGDTASIVVSDTK